MAIKIVTTKSSLLWKGKVEKVRITKEDLEVGAACGAVFNWACTKCGALPPVCMLEYYTKDGRFSDTEYRCREHQKDRSCTVTSAEGRIV